MDSDENRDVSSSPKRNLKIVIENDRDPNTRMDDNETTSEACSSPVSSRLRSSPTKSSPMNLGVERYTYKY
jgi:hypothetical protein